MDVDARSTSQYRPVAAHFFARKRFMPIKSKSSKSSAVDVSAHQRTSSDSNASGSDTVRVSTDPSMRQTSTHTAESGQGAAHVETMTATAMRSTHVLPISGSSGAGSEAASLAHYLIPSPTALPDADAQGFRVFKGRQYVDLQDGGVVLIGVDAETGLYRAKLPSEAHASGPVLAHDAQTNRWYPLQDYSTDTDGGSAIMPGRSRESSPHSDDDFESALEDVFSESAEAGERFYLASESMPVKPYTTEELEWMRAETPYSFLSNRRGHYNRANNGKYPLRDTAGMPIRIKRMQNKVRLKSGEWYSSEPIKPYIKFGEYEKVAQLYEEKLQWRLFTEADVKVPGERSLIDQSMVVANRRLAKGEAIGVYGGVITPKRFVRRHEQTFATLAGMRFQYGPGHLIPDPLVVLGDNILSRINSNFEYDATGRPVRQAASGYNVEFVSFSIEAQQLMGKDLVTKEFILNGIIASEDIPAGTELRLDYGYSEQQMSLIFS
jgi:hypothetical protein